MSNDFFLLNNDNDVLAVGEQKDAYLVFRLRQILAEKFNHHDYAWSIRDSLNSRLHGILITDFIEWHSSSEGFDCQVLQVGSQRWQKGKLKICVRMRINPDTNQFDTIVELRFKLDELETSELKFSLLDNVDDLDELHQS